MSHKNYPAGHAVRPALWGLPLIGVLMMVVSQTMPAKAEDLPPANKILAFVSADGCELGTIKDKVSAVGKALAQNEATSWVAITFPANPKNNIDMLGNPAPYIASVEAGAPTDELPAIEKDIAIALGTACRVDIYTAHERPLIKPTRTWELGQPTPGVKGYRFLLPRDGNSLEFFNDEWAGPHAKMVLGDGADAKQKSGTRYIQTLVLSRADENSPPYAGIGEEGNLNRGAPTAESIKQAQSISSSTPSEMRAHADVFIDTSKLTMFEAQEIILKD